MTTNRSCHVLRLSLLAGTAAVALAVLGCTRQSADQPVAASAPAPASQPPEVSGEIAATDDYVYYPEYEVYYSSRRHLYGYRSGSRWDWRPAPPNIEVNRLRTSPSVHMDFHDAPERHHSEVIRAYPHNWRGPGDQRPRDKDERRDDDHKH